MNSLIVAIWFNSSFFPSPLFAEVNMNGGSSSNMSEISSANISTCSNGVALFPPFALRFLSAFVNTIVHGISLSAKNSKASMSNFCGLTVESTNNMTDIKFLRFNKYSLVNFDHSFFKCSGALANPYPGRSTKNHFPCPLVIS